MWEDPIVAEVHRIRQEILAEYDGDLHSMLEDIRGRSAKGEFGDRIVRHPPRLAQPQPPSLRTGT
jgi:hypothetical protein